MPKPKQTTDLAHAIRATGQDKNALDTLSGRLQVERGKLWNILKNTSFKGANDEQMIALVIVANAYGLNPLTRELYAFPDKRGGIVPVVSIDGWARIINDREQYDNCEFETVIGEDGMPVEITCIMFRKDRSHPCKITEYYKECKRETEPWKMMPFRMLRHKALIQCARYSFGFGGIYDEDEARTIIEVAATTGKALPMPEIPPAAAMPDFPKEEAKPEPEPEPEHKPQAEPEPPVSEPESKEAPEDELPMGQAPPPVPPPQAPQIPPAGRASYNTVISLCKKDGFSTIELMAWAKEANIAPPNAKFLSSLSEKELGGIIKNWNLVGKQIAEMRGGNE